MSKGPKKRVAQVEKFVQTQEGFDELDPYLTTVSSHQLALLKSKQASTQAVTDPDKNLMIKTKASKDAKQESPQVDIVKKPTGDSFKEVDMTKSEASLTCSQLCMSEEEWDGHQCDSELGKQAALTDWASCVSTDYTRRDRPIPMPQGCPEPSNALMPYDQAGCLVPSPKSVSSRPGGRTVPITKTTGEIIPKPPQHFQAATNQDSCALPLPSDDACGVTITEITSGCSVTASQLLVLSCKSSSQLIPTGSTIEIKKSSRAPRIKSTSESKLASPHISRVPSEQIRNIVSDSVIPVSLSIQNKLDLGAIRTQSKLALEKSLSTVLRPGISGLREFISTRHLGPVQDEPQLNRFIDHFVQCDGLRYLGILEQIELDFEERCKAALLHAEANEDAKATELRERLIDLAEIQPVYQAQLLKNVNFHKLLRAEIAIFELNCKAKISAIKKIHRYGLKMEEYWYSEIGNGKQIDPTEIYDTATKLIAELIAQVFSILVKLCEHLVFVCLNAKKYKHVYSLEKLISMFSNFRMLTVDEVGAVGETCGEVMMRIPQLQNEVVYDLMTKLYSQINFIDICLCRALRAVVPLILYYDLQRNRKRSS